MKTYNLNLRGKHDDHKEVLDPASSRDEVNFECDINSREANYWKTEFYKMVYVIIETIELLTIQFFRNQKPFTYLLP